MEFSSEVTDRRKLVQYPNASKCSGYQCNSSYDQRMRVRRSCIESASTGPYILSGIPTVVPGQHGLNYNVGDYIELVGGTPTMQPVLLYVATLTGTGVATVKLVNAMPYSMYPPTLSAVPSKTISGVGSGAVFYVVFVTNNVECVPCALD